MPILLEEISEVKRIFTAVNLETHDVHRYLASEEDYCPYYLDKIPGAYEKIIKGIDGSQWDGEGDPPDGFTFLKGEEDLREVCLLPYEGVTTFRGARQEYDIELVDNGGKFLWIKREAQPGEVTEDWIWTLKARATEASMLQEDHQKEIPQPAPGLEGDDQALMKSQAKIMTFRAARDEAALKERAEREVKEELERPQREERQRREFEQLKASYEKEDLQTPREEIRPQRSKRSEEITGPEADRDNVVEPPEAKKRPVRHILPPMDVLELTSKMIAIERQRNAIGFRFQTCSRVLHKMHARAWYGPLNEVWGYAGKSTKEGRYYVQGNKKLEDGNGLSDSTVDRCLKWLKKEKILLCHKRGYYDKRRSKEKDYQGEGCSIWELPCNVAQINAWKRYVKSHPRKGSSRRK